MIVLPHFLLIFPVGCLMGVAPVLGRTFFPITPFAAAFGAAFRAAFRAAFKAQATVDFKGLIPFLGAILGRDLGCGRSLLIIIDEVNCLIEELFVAAKALVSTPLDAGG